MSKTALFVLALVLWITPAVVAGILGWPGIWGSGSAFGDLIVPAPITGGIFHVPSFVAALVLANLYFGLPDRAAALLRAGILAAALVGLAQLFNLERLYLSITTDVQSSPFRLHRNYFGLCLLTDAAITWLWLTAARRTKLNRIAALAIALLPVTAYVTLALATNDRLQEDFLRGSPGYSEQRGDGFLWLYSRLPPEAPEFRAAALKFLHSKGPEHDPNVQDLAVYFSNSLDVARDYRHDGEPFATLCLYEDGTPAAWHTGRADCFSEHENFHERLIRHFDELPDELPREVQAYRVALAICADVEVPKAYVDNEAVNYCRHASLDKKLLELESKHGAEALKSMLDSERESPET
ncbi:MAG: hypothetical protein AAFX56_00795 [Pseudomonadota bacterium]